MLSKRRSAMNKRQRKKRGKKLAAAMIAAANFEISMTRFVYGAGAATMKGRPRP